MLLSYPILLLNSLKVHLYVLCATVLTEYEHIFPQCSIRETVFFTNNISMTLAMHFKLHSYFMLINYTSF